MSFFIDPLGVLIVDGEWKIKLLTMTSVTVGKRF